MFYTIIIFCHDSDLMSPNTSNSFSMQISHNIISVSSRVDKRPSRIKIQTFYHLPVFFTCQPHLCIYVCVSVGGCVWTRVHMCFTGCLFAYFSLVIWRFSYNSHMFLHKHENKQLENCLCSLTIQCTISRKQVFSSQNPLI